MAIDADLSAGLITDEQARKRREEIARESDFYGAMDGASKFVRGDVIAALLITFINIIGGLIIGTVQRGMSLAECRSHLYFTDDRRRAGKSDSGTAYFHGLGYYCCTRRLRGQFRRRNHPAADEQPADHDDRFYLHFYYRHCTGYAVDSILGHCRAAHLYVRKII